MDDVPAFELLRLTALITSAHLSRTSLATDELDDLIRTIYAALAGAGATPPPAVEKRWPAVPVRKSIFPDYLVCLEDGRKFRMLRRHLRTAYGLTPAAYRERWNLPADYPMIAPNYAAHRSMVAMRHGLGRKRETAAESQPGDPPVQRVPEGRRGKAERRT